LGFKGVLYSMAVFGLAALRPREVCEAFMSHHLDSELARKDPRLDISDVYIFRGQSGTVFIVNVNPVSGSGGFHPEAAYEVKIDTDDDAVENLTYRFTFGEQGADGRQMWRLSRREGAEAADPFADGESLLTGTTDFNAAAQDGGVRAWVGVAADPFWIDGTVVTEVRTALADGTSPALDSFDRSSAKNIFGGTNVHSIVLELADTDIPASRIGFWAVTVLPTDAGGRRQINRCAHPLLNTLFVLEDAERGMDFNATNPREDRDRYGNIVVGCIRSATAVMGHITNPDAHATAVRDTLLPDVLSYSIGTEACFAVDQRNGRHLTDNAPEAMFELVLGRHIALGLDQTSAGTPRPDFPYVPLPAGHTSESSHGT
jgi:hypothetical protein